MTSLVKPGLLFQAEPMFKRALDAGAPCPNTTYVVCQDGTIQNYHEPTRPVNWRLTEDAMGWYYDGNKPLAVYFRGRTDDPPIGASYMDRQDSPQFGEITEQVDTGSEVESTPPPTPRGEPVCPGAPRKGGVRDELLKIATLDPNLAEAAAFLNDPEQTAALAKFAEGKMSYAEMRGLCG
jgi:hypothetical protein